MFAGLKYNCPSIVALKVESIIGLLSVIKYLVAEIAPPYSFFLSDEKTYPGVMLTPSVWLLLPLRSKYPIALTKNPFFDIRVNEGNKTGTLVGSRRPA